MSAITRIFDDLPERMKSLPVSDKGFPVPFFATWFDGKPDFRVITAEKMAEAVRRKLCWVCGQQIGAYMAFVIGPMCGINRTISDPPSHRDCAIFAAKNCPFMANPLAKRNARDLPEERSDAAGFGIKRNPGAVGVWVTKSYSRFKPQAGQPGILFRLGDPVEVLWFASGRSATRAEVEHSVATGICHLEEFAKLDGPAGEKELARRRAAFASLLPA
jgi:hypothetical protein